PLERAALPDPLGRDGRARRLEDPGRRAATRTARYLGRLEDALHAELGMAVDRAHVGVLALLQGDGEHGRLAVPEDFRLLARDLEVVLEGALVRDLEGDLAVRRRLARQDELVLLRGDLHARRLDR